MKKINVLVTGIGSAGVGEQILKSLLISDLNLKIVGTNISENCHNRDIVNRFSIVPLATDESYGKEIHKIIREESIDIIFPGSDPELNYFSKNRNQFHGISLGINSDSLIQVCLNKNSLYEALFKKGIDLPFYKKINSVEDCLSIEKFPVILKPNTGSGGSAHIYMAFNQNELCFFTQYMLDRKIDIILQEYVPYQDNEYTIGVSHDQEGNHLGTIILKRDLSTGLSVSKKYVEKGEKIVISSGVSQGSFVHDSKISIQAKRIAEAVNSFGPLNVQARYFEGKLQLMEINPRLSGTTYLRALAGYNEPQEIIRQKILKLKPNYNYQDITVSRSLVEQVLGQSSGVKNEL